MSIVAHRTRWLGAIVILAVAVRALFTWLYLRHPLSAVVPEDTEAYRTLARAVAGGDWRHPSFAYLSPLYGLLLAPVAGRPPSLEHLAIAVLQIALEAASVVLLAWIGRRLAGDAVGLVAAALYAVYGISIFYSAVELPVTVMGFLMLSIPAAAFWAKARTAPHWMVPGGALGLLALARPNAVVMMPALLAWTFAVTRRRAWPRLAWLLVGAGVVLSPLAVRSWKAGSGLSPFPVNGGINFYIGNHADANGMYVSVDRVSDLPLEQVTTSIAEASRRAGRSLDARAASRHWFEAGLTFLRDAPGAATVLTLKKAALFLRAEEIPLNTNYNFVRARVAPLRLTLGFGLLLPLAAAGLVALLADPERRRDADVWLLIGLAGLYAASVIAFFISDRYRLPIVPLLCVLAGHAVAAIIGRRRAWPIALAVAVAAGGLAHYPFAAFTYPEYAKDYFQLGNVHRDRREMDAAIALHRQAVALSPEEPAAFVELAHTYYLAGRPLDAEMALRQALRLQPNLAAARKNLALLYRDQGLFAEAIATAADESQRAQIEREAENRRPGVAESARFAQVEHERGMRDYGERRLAEARYAFKRAVAADPRADTTYFALALVCKDLRLRDEACAAITRAAALKPQDTEYARERDELCESRVAKTIQ